MCGIGFKQQVPTSEQPLGRAQSWLISLPYTAASRCPSHRSPSHPDGMGSLTAIVSADGAFQESRENQPAEKMSLLSEEPPTACV